MSKASMLELATKLITEQLEELRPGFVPGTKFTFIARDPGDPEAGIILSEDNINDVERFVRKWNPTSRLH